MNINPKVKRELLRLSPVLAIVAVVFIKDDARSVLFYALGISTAFLGFSHIARKILFPYADLEVFFKEALRGNNAAALVILAVCIVLSTLIATGVGLLK